MFAFNIGVLLILNISGAIYKGVPTNVSLFAFWLLHPALASPKSPSLTLPFRLIYMFSLFISLWLTFSLCRKFIDSSICLNHFLIVDSRCAPFSLTNVFKLPPSNNSVINTTLLPFLSNQQSINSHRPGCFICFHKLNSFLILSFSPLFRSVKSILHHATSIPSSLSNALYTILNEPVPRIMS